MLVLLASPRWRWCLGEYILVPYRISCCMKPTNIRPDTRATYETLFKPTYGAHLFHQVSWTLRIGVILTPKITKNLVPPLLRYMRSKVWRFLGHPIYVSDIVGCQSVPLSTDTHWERPTILKCHLSSSVSCQPNDYTPITYNFITNTLIGISFSFLTCCSIILFNHY